MRSFVAIVLALTLGGATAADWASIELRSVNGETVRPADPGNGPFAVLVFVSTDCPIANAFQPELRRLEARARELGGCFTQVHADPQVDLESVQRHIRDFAVTAPVVIDREHRLVQATGVEMTPEAVVIAPSGEIAYRGRINNLFVTYGKRRAEATEHDLLEAMEAVTEGRPVKQARTEALGCYIPRLGR